MRGISEKQAVILFAIIIIATKFQRFPSLIAQLFGRDGWLVILLIAVAEFLFLFLLMKYFTRLNKKSIYETFRERYGIAGQVFVALLMMVYFYLMCILTYKSNHEFFAKTLFDKLPWEFYSLILIFTLFIMAKGGLNCIGRTSELLSVAIGFGLIFAIILGLVDTKFDRLLPVLDVDIAKFGKDIIKVIPWFGDFMYILPMFGFIRVDENSEKKFTKAMIFTYIIASFVVALFYIIFYCLNGNLSIFQSSGLSSITQYTLIGLGIGRPDWFLVLFAFLATILCTAYTAWVFTYAMAKLFNVKNKIWTIVVGLIFLYIGDVFLLPNIEVAINFYEMIVSIFMLVINLLLPVLFIISSKRRAKNG